MFTLIFLIRETESEYGKYLFKAEELLQSH